MNITIIKGVNMEVEIFEAESPLYSEIKHYHREGIHICCFCGWENRKKDDDGFRDDDMWYREPYFLQLLLHPYISQYDSCVAISECPECHDVSWVHRSLEALKNDAHAGVIPRDIIDNEEARRFALVKERFEKSLCRRCKYVTEMKPTRWGTRLQCETERCTSNCNPTDECERFAEGNFIRDRYRRNYTWYIRKRKIKRR